MPSAVQRQQRGWQRVALAASSGLLLTAIYPPFGLSILAWVALTPLLIALDGTAPLSGFLVGWLSGTLGALGVTGYWIFRAAGDYFQLPPATAAAFPVGVTQIFVSVYFALFGLAVAVFGRRRWRFVFIPAAFVATEYARAHLLSGCPWELLGHSQDNLTLIQLCDLTGVYGVSFVLALGAAVLADLRRTRVPLLCATAAVAGVLAYGQWRLHQADPDASPTITLGLVQADLPNAQRGRPEFYSTHLALYLGLTASTMERRPDLIIWPENAVGFFPEANPALVSRITERLRQAEIALLTGAPHGGGAPGVAAIYNSAYLFDSSGVVAVYDKRKLLPFVERLPLRPDEGPYLPGTEATIFSVDGRRFGVLICFEAIYAGPARELVERGAQFLVNISNDSWFEAGAGPEQHYQVARFRAVENRVSLVRVTNSGVSGVIDPAGREIARLPPRAAVAQVVMVPLSSGRSLYTRYGDVFAAVCIALSLGALGFALIYPEQP